MHLPSNQRKACYAIVLILLLALLISCGGGSSGTGSTGSLDFQGRIRTAAGTPVEGVEVTIGETGDLDITDENGEFSIQTSFTGAEVNLFIEQAGIGQSLNLGEIPPDSRVDIDVVIAIQGNTIVITVNSLTITPL